MALSALWTALHALGQEPSQGPGMPPLEAETDAAPPPRGSNRMLALLLARRQREAAPSGEGQLGAPEPAAPPAPAPAPEPTPLRLVAADGPTETVVVPAEAAGALETIERTPEGWRPLAQPATGAPPAPVSAASKTPLPVQLGERRRDPVEPPLVPGAGWHELLLSVVLNGRKVSEGALFLRDPATGRLAVPLSQLATWRISPDARNPITFEGEAFYPLDGIAGATAKLDLETLALRLDVPPEAFAPFAFGPEPEPTPAPVIGKGAFADYDLQYSAGGDVQERLDGLLELGSFGSLGVFGTSLKLDDLLGSPGVTRLETQLIQDLPARRETVRLGDSLTAGGTFGQPVRFGGVQWATNFATDPSFVTFPLPAIGGLADQRSVVDVLVDNLRRASGEVPPGPFSFRNIPVVTGAGEVQLTVKDLLGREHVVTQPYYVSSRLLRSGLQDFSFEAGFERKSYGDESFDYGEALGAGTYRYGLTDTLTGEAHGELQPDRQSLALGGSWLAGRWGVLSGGIGASHDDEQQLGGLAQLAYEYDGRSFNAGARTRYTSGGFRELGVDDGHTRRVDQLNLGLDLGAAGRLGLLFINEDRRSDSDQRLATATWSRQLGPGTVILSAGQTLAPDHETTVMLTYAVPLGGNRSVSAEARTRDSDALGRLQFRQSRGASDLGLDYRVAVEAGSDARPLDARVGYQTTHGGADLEVEHVDGTSNMRAGIDGSLSLIDGQVEASRRLGAAFGLVEAPGAAGARVYLDNREVGRTDQQGRLLLPDLRPYQANHVRLAVDDLPLDANPSRIDVTAVPYAGNGIPVRFEVSRARQATAIVQGPDGRPLPAGLKLASGDGTAGLWVGRYGFAQLTGIGEAPVQVSGEADGRRIVCTMPAVPKDALLPDLGTLRCD
jgi:outer membrane usher protein